MAIWTKQQKDFLLNNYTRYSTDELVEILGKSKGSIYSYLHFHGIYKNSHKVYQGTSICWQCQNAVPNRDGTRGCSWSKEFIPVEGWKAKRNERSEYLKSGKGRASYTVITCPEFIKDEVE